MGGEDRVAQNNRWLFGIAFITDPIGWYVENALFIRGIIEADEVFEVSALFNRRLQFGDVAQDRLGYLKNDIQLADVLAAKPKRFVQSRINLFRFTNRLGELDREVSFCRSDALRPFDHGDFHVFQVQEKLESTWNFRLVWDCGCRRAWFRKFQNFGPELVANPVELDIEFCREFAGLNQSDPAPRANEVMSDRYC